MVDVTKDRPRIKTLGNYILLKVLSDEGGFGTAWLGQDEKKDRLVCIKVLK
jgi:serine/threonine protein kinase